MVPRQTPLLQGLTAEAIIAIPTVNRLLVMLENLASSFPATNLPGIWTEGSEPISPESQSAN